ncbi:MAG: 7-cyano-7-deazaguanine synthase [Candidatus Nezhaarchaeota archaeon]|nr:7-cyano-7-deazaguanine synthase [Candidatus Nezhaarchaeota archaeon]
MVEVKVVAVVSGGIDSTSYAAYWRLKRGAAIYPLVFNYGQKAQKEVVVAARLCRELGLEEPRVLDISFMKQLWAGTQLTDEAVVIEEEYAPTVVVPIRNAVFLTIATAYAYTIDASVVTIGSHLDDAKLNPSTSEPYYPDCHPLFLAVLEAALNLGHLPMHRRKVELWSPAREGLTKAQNLRRGYELMGSLIYETWSCYRDGDRHCGRCESCIKRRKAFIEAGVEDKTRYEVQPRLSALL